jgi:hypothetical protein
MSNRFLKNLDVFPFAPPPNPLRKAPASEILDTKTF